MTQDHGGLEILDREACDRLLTGQVVGRVAFMSAGEPLILPVNYKYHRCAIVFRVTSGEKLRLAEMNTPCAFEIDDWDNQVRRGWSVVVRGIMERVLEPDAIAEFQQLGLEPWATDVAREDWIRIRPTEVTGRSVG